MVTAERDDPRVMLAICGNWNEWFTREQVIAERGERRPVEELFVAVLDLLDGEFVVIRRDGDVTTVDNLEAGHKRVDFERDVVASV